MGRETILKHSKAIRLKHEVLPDFTDVIAEFCTIKGHPEHLSVIIQLLQQPIISNEIINAILEYFEKEYRIVKLEKLLDSKDLFGNPTINKQLINIY